MRDPQCISEFVCTVYAGQVGMAAEADGGQAMRIEQRLNARKFRIVGVSPHVLGPAWNRNELDTGEPGSGDPGQSFFQRIGVVRVRGHCQTISHC